MEAICNVLKSFMVTELPPYLAVLADTETPLPVFQADNPASVPPEKGNVFCGAIDIEKNVQKQSVFIVPDSQDISESTMNATENNTKISVYIFVRREPPDVLFRQAMRYAAAVKKAVLNNFTLSGEVEQAAVTKIDYFDNVENADNKIRAVCIEMTITTEEMED